MNTSELIDVIARDADVSKAQAKRMLDALRFRLHSYLHRGGAVQLAGVGTFSVGKRAARIGRNPRTGVPIKIKAKRVPVFRPAAAFKRAVN